MHYNGDLFCVSLSNKSLLITYFMNLFECCINIVFFWYILMNNTLINFYFAHFILRGKITILYYLSL